jgi:SAM-dependent methyltransferase
MFSILLGRMPEVVGKKLCDETVLEDGRLNLDALQERISEEQSYRFLSAILVNAQDRLWGDVDEVFLNQRDALLDTARQLSSTASGSLKLNEDLAVPTYLSVSDTHRMPGSFYTDTGENDIRAGVLYDMGGALYQMASNNRSNGQLLNDARGHTAVSFIMNEYPDFAPRRILDMGCTVGQSTLPYCDYYPDAEIHAIDIGAPVLRYAHARAAAMGRCVHFSQQNAEQTEFESNSFDLIVSHILLHETSNEAIKNILKESYRLLRDGGVMCHVEVSLRADSIPNYRLPFYLWEQFNNNEPNLVGVATENFVELVKGAGFLEPRIGYQPVCQDARTSLHCLLPEKPAEPSWFIIAGQK